MLKNLEFETKLKPAFHNMTNRKKASLSNEGLDLSALDLDLTGLEDDVS